MDDGFDSVQKPYHYNACGDVDSEGRSVYEPIKVIESWGLGWGFCLGNALKYILRAPHKGSERQDLEKALWYLERLHGVSRLPSTIFERLTRALRRRPWRKPFWYLGRVEDTSRLPSTMDKEPCDPVCVSKAWGLSQNLSEAVEALFEDAPERAAHYVAQHLGRSGTGSPCCRGW